MQNGGFSAKNAIFGRHLTETIKYKLKIEAKRLFFLNIAKASTKKIVF
jgi:hypothetical protein